MKTSNPQVERLILGQITKGTERDQQVKIGPSAIGDCARCVAVTLAQRLPEMYDVQINDHFSFTAWRGTAIHHYIETHFDLPNAIHERKLDIFDLPGYGMIRGSCDLYLPDFAQTFDWKCLSKYSHEKLKLYGASTKYRVQQHLYAYGWKKLQHPVNSVTIVSIPQHSNNVEDIYFWEEAYNQELVDAALERLETIWGWVQAGELEDIDSEAGCYQCERIGPHKVTLKTKALTH